MQAAYEEFGCNESNVFFIGIDKGNTNAAVIAYDSIYGVHYPGVSGQNGGGNIVHLDYSVQSTPSVVVIRPDRVIAVKMILPPSFDNVVDSITQTGGIPMECITSVDNRQKQNKIRLFPNPASQTFYVETSGLSPGNYTLQIFDFQGKEIIKARDALQPGEAFFNTNIEGLKKGLYMVRLSGNGQTIYAEKLIIAE